MVNQQDVIRRLKKSRYKVTEKTVKKNGASCDVIVINLPGTTTNPEINLENLILGNPKKSSREIFDMIEIICNQHRALDRSINKQFILSNVHIALQKKSENNIVKKKTSFDDIEAYLCIYSRMANNKQLMIKLTPKLLSDNKITEEEIWNQAKRNNRVEAKIITADEILKDNKELNKKHLPVYILTNNNQLYGAATILDKKLVDKKLSSENQKNWLVSLISVHQAVLIPKTATPETKALLETIKFIDKKETRQVDKLSYRTYEYAI